MSRWHQANRKRWAAVRRRVLERDGYRCRQCGKAGRLEVDHVVPLEKGGDEWDEANLQAICRLHHIQKTQGENRRPLTPAEAAWRELVVELTA